MDQQFTSLRAKIAAEKAERTERYAKFAEVFAKAQAAGVIAGEAVTPTPMVIVEQFPDAGRKYFEPEGMCGFAWVRIRPATSSFAKWLVKNKHARTAYNGGVDIWISGHNQSVARKEAHASAMAEILRAELGVHAYADSRLD